MASDLVAGARCSAAIKRSLIHVQAAVFVVASASDRTAAVRRPPVQSAGYTGIIDKVEQ